MRLAGTILALVVSLGTAPGQEANDPAQPSESGASHLCTVEGMVVKATTGEALKRITVSLSPLEGGRQPLNTTTDSAGRFVFSNLEPARYTLAAEGNGYSRQIFGQLRAASGGKILTLTPGGHITDLVFRLMPPAVITGTVYDEDGVPIMNAFVQAIRLFRAGGHAQGYAAGGVQTNDLGQYRIFGLEAGRYLICTNQSPRDDSSDDTYLPTFYPGTSDPGQATTIPIQPGDEVSGIDVEPMLVHGVRVRGQVVCEGATKVLQGVYVSLEPRETGLGRFVSARYGGPVSDDKGHFEIRGIPSGSYWMSATWYDGNRFFTGRVPLEVGNTNLDSATLVMGPSLKIRGRVKASPGGELNYANLSVWLQPAEGSPGGAGTQVQADGTFVLENVPDGTYRLRIGGYPEEFYVESARLGGMDVLGPGLSASRGDVGSLDVVLSRDGGSVEGTVLHNQVPFGGALVVLVPDPPNRNREDMYSVKSADPLGRFTLLGLPPGDFKLFAWEPREGLDFNDPDFLKDYEDRGTHVHVEAHLQKNVQLPLIPAEENAP